MTWRVSEPVAEFACLLVLAGDQHVRLRAWAPDMVGALHLFSRHPSYAGALRVEVVRLVEEAP